MTRVFIVHGWDGYPGEGWQGWLNKELTSRGDKVYLPAMPNPEWPRIETWVPFLAKQVGVVDAQTAFVGHSIGCQTILRYLETLPAGTHIGPVVLVAPWVTLTTEALHVTPDSMAIAQPWLDSSINWTKIQPMSESWTVILSTNDPWVPLTDGGVFQKNLGAKIVQVENRDHLSATDGIVELPEALEVFDQVWT